MCNTITVPATKTKHNDSCTMAFGKPSKHNDCPRCNELKQGAAPRQGYGNDKAKEDAQRLQAIRNHDCVKSGCGAVCTAFQW